MKGVARLGVSMIHDGKRERSLPRQRRFGFPRILTVPGFAFWRSARVMPVSCGGFWLWPRFMTGAPAARRPGSGASAYRRSAARDRWCGALATEGSGGLDPVPPIYSARRRNSWILGECDLRWLSIRVQPPPARSLRRRADGTNRRHSINRPIRYEARRCVRQQNANQTGWPTSSCSPGRRCH